MLRLVAGADCRADRLRAQGVEGPAAGLGASLASDAICQVPRRRAAQGRHGFDAGVQGKPRVGVSSDTCTPSVVPLHQRSGPSSYAHRHPRVSQEHMLTIGSRGPSICTKGLPSPRAELLFSNQKTAAKTILAPRHPGSPSRGVSGRGNKAPVPPGWC